MSAKNRRPAKKIRKLERALRKGRIPTKLNLIHWLEDHGYADTAGAARKLINEDRVMSESHPLGKQKISIGGSTKEFPDRQAMEFEIINPFVASYHRASLRVTEPKEA